MVHRLTATRRARALDPCAPFLIIGLLISGCVQGASVETPLAEEFVEILESLPNSPLPPAPEPEPEVVDTTGVCETYCTTVLENCVDDDEIYADETECLEACAGWPSNPDFVEGDGGDSLECRAHYAGAPAADEPEVHCPAAAPDGGGVCVDVEPEVPCEIFCDVVLANCVDDNEVYADEDGCLEACGEWPSNPDFVEGDGGDSLECRAHYGGDLAADDPGAHCPSAGADGGGVCVVPEPVAPCETYCQLALANCVDDNELYADEETCLAACELWPSDPAHEPGQGGDSVECRTYHAGTPAEEEPEAHCAHAGPDGGEVCVPFVEPGVCETDIDCLELEDGNACNGVWKCEDAICTESTKAVNCDQGGTAKCTERVCDPATGGCVEVNRANGSFCTADTDPCTLEDRCEDGQCVTGKRLYCDDGNPCTTDECKAGACKYTKTSAPSCDDGNPCTVDETCSGGICTGKSSACGCGSDEDCAPYDDGDLCNGVLECKSGKCKVKLGSPVKCGDSSEGPCVVSLCNPGTGVCEASPAPEGSGCTDGDECTVNDTCTGGECVGDTLDCPARPCHDVVCAPTGICTYTPQEDGADCDPGTPCMEGATCLEGGCLPVADSCACAEDGDCAASDDTDLCNGTLICHLDQCVTDPGSVPACPDIDNFQCQIAACDPETGICEVQDLESGLPCEDGDPCTGPGQCVSGGQCFTTSLACDEAPDCEESTCHPFAGCRNTAVGGTCDGDDPCAITSACASGSCEPKELLPCESDNPCRAPVCNPDQTCGWEPLTGSCDDGDGCTSPDYCLGGECVGLPKLCDQPSPCQVGQCEPSTGQCLAIQSDGGLCSDGNTCTVGDRCTFGACEGSVDYGCECVDDIDCADYGWVDGEAMTEADSPCFGTLVCKFGTCQSQLFTCPNSEEDNTPCTYFGCNALTGACEMLPRGDGTMCDDGVACTDEDRCDGGACAGFGPACEDGNPCTVDSCDSEGQCVHAAADGDPCNDGNTCTSGTQCAAGVCVLGADEGANTCPCATTGDCAAQEDGDACNGTLICEDDVCVVDPTSVVTCGGQVSQCSVEACNPATGTCETSLLDGAPCQDGDLCTTGDVCEGGACAGGDPLVCVDEDNPCRLGTCDTVFGGCKWENVGECSDLTYLTKAPCLEANHSWTAGGDCDDSNPCTINDSCQGGECLGDQNVCPCTSDQQCRDQLPDQCLGDVICGPGGCEVVPGTAIDCSAETDTPCAFQKCEPDTGACGLVTLDEGASCDDGDACTFGTTCDASGDCSGAAVVCDDLNECTEDACDPVVGCEFTAFGDGSPCEDYDGCTSISICQVGQCNGLANTCACQSTAQCPEPTNDRPDHCSNPAFEGQIPCEDAGHMWFTQGQVDYCGGQYNCSLGKCVKGSPVVCQATTDVCAPQVCQPNTGVCEKVAQEEGTPCDDDDPCTSDDVCKSHPILGGFCKGTEKYCGDDNPCTQDSCLNGGCKYSPLDGVICEDGDPCTKPNPNLGQEVCADGICQPGFYVCLCSTLGSTSECDQYDDKVVGSDPPVQNLCNGVWRCEDVGDISPTGKGCLPDPDTVVECDDVDPYDCIFPECTPGTGLCIYPTGVVGAPCDDGSVCTVADTCQVSGQCTGINTVVCNDPNPDDCADTICHPVLGSCEPEPRPDNVSCDDHNQCTTGDRCIAGGCQGELVECDDDEQCTDDFCSVDSGCHNTPRYGACDDGNPCTDGDVCEDSACEPGPALPCTCTVNGAECYDDGDQCNGLWTCQNFSCQFLAGSVVSCDEPDNPCLEAVCASATGGCVETTRQDGYPCDDGDICTSDDQCTAGACAGGPKCDDDNTCTDDGCDEVTGTCTNSLIPDGGPCDDGDTCTGSDTCGSGVCLSGSVESCLCETTEDCAAFEDGDLCNGTLRCVDDACDVNPLSVITCGEDPTGCNELVCEGDTGACVPQVALDGTSCNDSDLCSVDDRCTGGVCAGTPLAPGSPLGCDDGDECTQDECDPDLGCVHHLFVGPCDDGDPCTYGDECSGGSCIGKPDNCDDGNPCTKDDCDVDVGCGHEAKDHPCNDGNPCTTPDHCIDGTCIGPNECPCTDHGDCESQDDGKLCNGVLVCEGGKCVLEENSILDCGESTHCKLVYCNNDLGCVEEAQNPGQDCDDGDACTENSKCVGTECAGTIVDCSSFSSGFCSASCTCDTPGRTCTKGTGCEAEDIVGSCESDGKICTVYDRCVEGVCQGVASVPPSQGFDDGDLGDWTLSSTAELAGWGLTGAFTYEGPLALHAANTDGGSMIDAGGAWSATAEGPAVDVPEGVIFAEVRFQLRMDVTDQTCDGDVLHVQLNGETRETHCADTDGFIQAGINITADKGQFVSVGFVVESAAGGDTGDVGITVDEVTFDWSCPIQ